MDCSEGLLHAEVSEASEIGGCSRIMKDPSQNHRTNRHPPGSLNPRKREILNATLPGIVVLVSLFLYCRYKPYHSPEWNWSAGFRSGKEMGIILLGKGLQALVLSRLSFRNKSLMFG